MGKPPCCEKNEVKKGPWSIEEDNILVNYIRKHGQGRWRTLPKDAGLKRCGKSCRLRWTNYLRPDIKRGRFTAEEEDMILQLHSVLGNKWSAIAAQLPGRTDNEIKNFWNTHVKKKLLRMGIDPITHVPCLDLLDLHSILSLCNYYQVQSLDIANIPITNFHQNHTLPSVLAPPHDSKMGNYTSFAHFHDESLLDMSSITQLGNNVASGFPSFCQRPVDYAPEINASQMNFNGCEKVRNYCGIRSSLSSPMSKSSLTLTSSPTNTARVGSSNIGDAEIKESYGDRSFLCDSGNGFHVSGLM